VLQKTFEKEWFDGKRPYLIPLGASNAIGALGYVTAIEELAQQEIQPDWIIVASSSGGTQAGMELGIRRIGWKTKILGISINHKTKELQNIVSSITIDASDHLGEKIKITPEDILVNSDYLGGGYAVLGESEIEAIRLFAQNEGIIIGPVYTGRAAAAMIDLIRKSYFKDNETVLFWHTGDNITLFADPYTRQITKQ
jgi:1-aminocyclopropane-1-carboxylate deaminase/D-cysteine desulfhydrase-like pyridoxal-dependent ACC family enzyme